MDRQEQIDKIARWMGWHKYRYPYIGAGDPTKCWFWIHGKDYNGAIDPARGHDFDPFTNPSDCARVMDGVVKRGWEYRITVESEELAFCLLRKDTPQYLTWNDLSPFIGKSWMEAFCLALLEAIGKE